MNEMRTDAPEGIEEPGQLHVRIDSRSMYFGAKAPYEVRDADMRVVMRGSGQGELELEPGIYQVSAVLEDGGEHSRIVQVEEGETAEVRIGLGTPRPEGYPSRGGTPRLRATLRSRSYFQRVGEINEGERAAIAPNVGVELTDVDGAEVLRETRTLWVLLAKPDIEAVPAVTLRLGDERLRLSLPTSPGGGPNLNTCTVRVDETAHGPRAAAWISSERTVANALQNMVGSGHFGHATRMADEATGLLRGKYDDPTGAALGALVLYRAGRLESYRSWLENLCRDFSWLPDGKILLAAMLMDLRDDVDRARALVSEASAQRVLFTESYSILLGLLRRWPNESERGSWTNDIARLADRSPDTDRDALCLTQRLPE